MPVIQTLSGRSRFSYRGDVQTGVVLEMRQEYTLSAELFIRILHVFANSNVPLGANMTDPIPGGLGEWVAQNATRVNPGALTPRHASFIAAILVHEQKAACTLDGNRIIIHFTPAG